jgi:predicted nuclease of predicted toxin-antitoxin system
MKFLADVNIPQSVIRTLRNHSHDVLDSKENFLTARDIEIIHKAKTEKRIIITRDKDFIALTQYPKYYVATIVIRLHDQIPLRMQRYLIELLANQKASILEKSLTIIREDVAESFPF